MLRRSTDKRTKIVCTVGPTSADPRILTRMVMAGMNVARLNFSHGTHASHQAVLKTVRSVERKTKQVIAVLADLQGPKIRLGELPADGVDIHTGREVVFSTASSVYKSGLLPVTYAGLHKDVKVGDRILIDDGLLEVKVLAVHGTSIRAKVINGGHVSSHKGMNFPDSTLRVPALTAKDRADAKFAVKAGVEYIALSFVTSAKDIRTLRGIIQAAASRGTVLPRIIVKIEKHEAITRFLEILAETDAVMIARGDLGVEIPAAEVPVKQKEMIMLCRLAGKPVVVATQMLDSMIRNPRPTRAEVSDVANAVFDHTDAVMLSGETASGKYPVEAVTAMANIIREAEQSSFDDIHLPTLISGRPEAAIAQAIKLLADAGEIQAVAAHGDLTPWAETLLSDRPEIPFVFASSDTCHLRQSHLRWGVHPVLLASSASSTLGRHLLERLHANTSLPKGARVALILGGVHGSGFDVVSL